jgi:superfamily II DNA or RNA helicase
MYLQRYLKAGVAPAVRQRGDLIYTSGKVVSIQGNQWSVRAEVMGTQLYEVELRRKGDEIHVSCDCEYYEGAGVCKHIWAVIRAADAKYYLLGRVGSGMPRLVDDLAAEKDIFPEFVLDVIDGGRWVEPAKQPRRPGADTAWKEALHGVERYQTGRETAPEWPRGRVLYYVVDLAAMRHQANMVVEVNARDPLKTGALGKPKALRVKRDQIAAIPEEADRDALMVLAGAPELYGYYNLEVIPSAFVLSGGTARHVLPKLCATGRCLLRRESGSPIEEWAVLRWDGEEPWRFEVFVERAGDRWVLNGRLRRGDAVMALNAPVLMSPSGVMVANGGVALFETGGARAWLEFLRERKEIAVPEWQGHALVAEMMSRPEPPEVSWPEELRFEQVQEPPRVCFRVSDSPEYMDRRNNVLRGELSFDYGERMVPEGAKEQGMYDAKRRLYVKRHEEAERAAAELLKELGVKRPRRPYYYADADSWQVPGKKLNRIVPALARAGWKLQVKGRKFRHSTGFRAELSSGIDWFDLRAEVEFGEAKAELPAVLEALRRNEGVVELTDGSFGLLPEELLEKYGMLLKFGKVEEGGVRFSRSQAGLLDVLLAGKGEVKVDEVFVRARERLAGFAGVKAAAQPRGFSGTLRGYQLEGLGWMHFLREFGFGGCLADDMGVGKTPQVLALLEERRAKREAGEDVPPSLVVAPRSLIYNWQLEAAKFTPALKVLDHTGTSRARETEAFTGYDLVLTTYGTLRRDAASFKDHQFDYVILDEAQAIKNAASESAKAARLLEANHRLALSGTPVENHLGELWSLFEFLNPGMLGAASVFQAAGGPMRNPDEATRQVLSRALRPFILRRTKEQVASELPEKQEQTLYCEMEAGQRKIYEELRDHYRMSLLGRIDKDGMAKARMHVLEALLRLRQAACHPGLIDTKRASESSAKLDMLMPTLVETIEEGHKVLVFSQFTSFLAILREQLGREGIAHEYLDGKTRNRQACVERFQTDDNCKLFLVSLKAGGVGLNLTAAEYVFLLDPWWNPAVESQAIDRAHRIGQTRRVFAYRLIARDTVEEKVLALQENKRDLADAILHEDNRTLRNLTREDLELLLS